MHGLTAMWVSGRLSSCMRKVRARASACSQVSGWLLLHMGSSLAMWDSKMMPGKASRLLDSMWRRSQGQVPSTSLQQQRQGAWYVCIYMCVCACVCVSGGGGGGGESKRMQPRVPGVTCLRLTTS
jgi:hypothetical protein